MKSIAVLLTVHNRKENTLKCLSALYAQRLPEGYSLKVYLTDDGCTDGTADAVKNLYPDVEIIQGDGSLFWNRGMVRAWEVATQDQEHDFYLWLNDDTFLFSECLQVLFAGSIECNHQSIIVGATKSTSTNKITYGGRDVNDVLLQPNGVLQQCHHFNGNVVLIPKYVYKIVGKLDPIFHHALGDFDYGLRAGKAQIRMYVASEFVGYCEGHDNFAKWCQPERPLQERYQALYSSTCDCNPKQFFAFESRHYGRVTAVFHWITIHIRLIFPKVWNLRKSY